VRLLEDNTSDADATATIVTIDESGWDHGQPQPKACRDCFWGFLFLLQFSAVVTLAVMGIRNMVKEG